MNSSDLFPEFCTRGSVNGQMKTTRQMAPNLWLFLFCSLFKGGEFTHFNKMCYFQCSDNL